MRKQIAAANWKMNLSFQQADQLLKSVVDAGIATKENQQVIFAVPFLYLSIANQLIGEVKNFNTAAQNCYQKKEGAFTGEISAAMLHSMNIRYCLVGHSERREFGNESNEILSEKVNRCLENSITPIFCCGESLAIRDADQQKSFVETQLRDSLFHLSKEQITNLVIAYEPIWAIGTGKTATNIQVQEMHAHIRSVISNQYGTDTGDKISILYGGSVKASNAKELFNCDDVDGGLVGGASLQAEEFIQIIKALKC